MAEFYRDEHPKDKGPWWGNPPMPTGGIGGRWGDGGDVDGGDVDGGGGGGGELDGGDGEKWFLLGFWRMDFPLLLTDSAGRLLSDATDVLLYSSGGCLTLNIECQIMGDTAGHHISCLIAGVDAIESSHSGGMLKDLLLNGALSVKVKWQAGHYDIGKVHTARFRINESEPTPWIVIPLAENPCEVMQIEIVDGQIRPVRAIKR